jgi:alcohol dehydrogenase class IV
LSDRRAGLPEAARLTGFSWRDGDRLIRFGPDAAAEASEHVAASALTPYVLLTTARAEAGLPALAAGAAHVFHVPAGPVPQAAAIVHGQLGAAAGGRAALVALGGGRVIDVTKAIASADGRLCAAVPTTLSGAEMTRAHRALPGFEGASPVRPALVVNDPALSASQPLPGLAASAMNALGHAFEALYGPGANPEAEAAALRAAALLAAGLAGGPPRRGELALGGLLAGFAVGSAGMSLHHVLCQTIVALAGTPHAATNAVLLPHTVRFMSARLPQAGARFTQALVEGMATAASQAEPGDLVASLAARAGVTELRGLGVAEAQLPAIAAAVRSRLGGSAGGRPLRLAEIETILEEAL